MTDEQQKLDFASEAELRRAKYSKIEREPDSLGRVIGVRRLKLSEQTRLSAMTPDLGGVDEVPNPDVPGTTILVTQRAQYFAAAMVCEINSVPFTFPRNRGELDSVLDRLDIEGLNAAGVAISRLLKDDNIESGLEKAKNL